METILSSQLLSGLLYLILLLPFIFLPKRKWQKEDRRFLAIFFILFLLWNVLTTGFANIRLFEGQIWNWTGKTMGLLMSVFFIYRSKVLTSKDSGMNLRIDKKAFSPVLALFFLGILFRVIIYIALERPSLSFNTESILFQGTLNAISDEIFFRGILLALLNKLFTYGEDVFGFRLTWSVLITSLLFGLSQGLIFQNGFHLQINLIRILLAFVLGLIAALLKEKSGNIIPAILFHALWALTANH